MSTGDDIFHFTEKLNNLSVLQGKRNRTAYFYYVREPIVISWELIPELLKNIEPLNKFGGKRDTRETKIKVHGNRAKDTLEACDSYNAFFSFIGLSYFYRLILTDNFISICKTT